MKNLLKRTMLPITLLSLILITPYVSANDKNSAVYINKNVGFNIEGYSYKQPALPCDVDNKLVELIVEKSNATNIKMESVATKEKIQNGKIPVVYIDIEQLALSKEHVYGESNLYNLPKMQITTGILQGKELETAKHTCAVASTSSEHIMPTDVVEYDNLGITVCSEAQKCLEDLSKDVVEWLKPQLK